MIARVLVTDGEERSVLAACRGLGAAGYGVAVAAAVSAAPAQWSRSCEQRIRTPDPRAGRERFVSALERVLESRRFDVLLPGTEASLLAISDFRERLEPLARLGLPSPESVARSVDKVALLEAAAAVGLAAPESRVCTSGADAGRAAAELGYPVVLKAARSFLVSGENLRQQRTVAAPDADSLARAARSFEGPVIVQRYVAGRPLLSFAGVMLDRIHGATCARYLRTWPVDAGPSCFSQTVPVEPGLRDRVAALLRAVGWRGIFQLQLVELEGGHAAIDLNPRVFGSVALPIGAGANLPALWCDSLLGRSVGDAVARPGIRYRWEDGDAKHCIWQARHANLAAAASVLAPRPRVVHAYFRRADPLPFLVRLWTLARRLRARRVSS